MIRLLSYDFFALLSFRKLLVMISVFILIGLTTQKDVASMASIFNLEHNVADTLLFSFLGPDRSGFGMGLIKWFVIQVVLVYLVGKMLDQEIRNGSYYTIPRVGSLHLWFGSKLVSLFLFTLVYFLVGFGVVFLLSFYLNSFSIGLSDFFHEMILQGQGKVKAGLFQLLFHNFILLWLTGFLSSLLQLLVTIISNRATVGTIFIIILHAVSGQAGSFSMEFTKWLPSNQGILMRHGLVDPFSDLTLSWSYTYLSVGVLVAVMVSFYYINQKELIDFSSNF